MLLQFVSLTGEDRGTLAHRPELLQPLLIAPVGATREVLTPRLEVVAAVVAPCLVDDGEEVEQLLLSIAIVAATGGTVSAGVGGTGLLTVEVARIGIGQPKRPRAVPPDEELSMRHDAPLGGLQQKPLGSLLPDNITEVHSLFFGRSAPLVLAPQR